MSAFHQQASAHSLNREFFDMDKLSISKNAEKKEVEKGKKKMSLVNSFQNALAYVFPAWIDRVEIKDQSTLMRDEVQQYLNHAEADMKKARTAYCNELIEIAKHRTEAQSQLVRIREMQTVVEMMRTADTKSLEVMQQELNQYAGNGN